VAFVDSTADVDPIDSDEAELPAPPTPEPDGDDKVTFNFDPGSDGLGGLVITDYTDPGVPAEFDASGLDDLAELLGPITVELDDPTNPTTVTYLAGGEELFRLTVNVDDPDNYTFEVLLDAPIVLNPLDFSTLESGSPVPTITLTSADDTDARFDGYLFTGTGSTLITNPQNPNNGQDYLNPDNVGFGVFQGQSSNINNNEGFKLETFEEGTMTAKPVIGMQFSLDQQGNTDDVVLAFQLSLDGFGTGALDPTFVDAFGANGEILQSGSSGAGEFFIYTTLPSGNNDIIFTIIDSSFAADYLLNDKQSNEIVVVVNGEFDSALFKATYPDDDVNIADASTIDATATPFENDSIRIKDVFLIEQGVTPDVQLAFEVQGTDGDDDETADQSFTVGIDGNGDGDIIIA
jgi:hypothetical protein